MPVPAPLAFPEEVRDSYLHQIAAGKSRQQAARELRLSPAVINRARLTDPGFAAQEAAAELVATDAIEDVVWRAALGQRTAAEQEYVEALQEDHEVRQRAQTEDGDLPKGYTPLRVPPKEESLKAAELWLERRSPERWTKHTTADIRTHSTTVRIDAADLMEPDALASFALTLEARRAALTASATEGVPEPATAAGGRPAGATPALALPAAPSGLERLRAASEGDEPIEIPTP